MNQFPQAGQFCQFPNMQGSQFMPPNAFMNPMMMNQFPNNMTMNMGINNNMGFNNFNNMNMNMNMNVMNDMNRNNMNNINNVNNMNMNNMNNMNMNMNNMNNINNVNNMNMNNMNAAMMMNNMMFMNGNNMNFIPNNNFGMNNNVNMNMNNNFNNNFDNNNQVNNMNQANDMNNQNVQNQQEEAMKLIKKQEAEARKKLFADIINKESGENLGKIETISNMANMGAITRHYIEVDSAQNPNKYIPINDALKSSDQDYLILGILGEYLTKQGVVSAIEKRDQNQLSKEKLKEIDTFLQFLINGLSNLKKHEFRFDFGWEKDNLILTTFEDQQSFMNELKVSLSKGFNIKTNEVIITYPRSGSVIVTVIFLSEDFNNITINQVKNILSVQCPDYSNLIGLESHLVLDGILLNPELLDHKGDNKNQGWGYNEKRGGRPYFPPKGWIGYGLKVWGKYDKGNNNWIGHQGETGEWCVAYHGASQKLNNNYKAMRDVNDANHPGSKVGEGVYCSPNPNVLDQEGGVIQVGAKKYKIGFMLRVKPDKIRIAQTNQDYWVLNGTSDEIRPYRILIKHLN